MVVPGNTAAPGESRKGAAGAAAVPDCVTRKLAPAIIAFAEREVVDAFAAQETVTLPLPLPLGDETVSQAPFPAAVHVPPWQPAGEPTTATCWEPAADAG